MIEWDVRPGLTPYPEALADMEARAGAVAAGTAPQRVQLVEHPPLYTAGTSAKAADLTDPDRFPVFETGRGGEYTYHGPGQRVVYPVIDLRTRGRDVRAFVQTLEKWIVDALGHFNVRAYTVPGRVGAWVETSSGEAKIAAIGVRIRRWVSFHGLSINVAPDLTHFGGIVPCGLSLPVTSLAALGKSDDMNALDRALLATCPFGQPIEGGSHSG